MFCRTEDFFWKVSARTSKHWIFAILRGSAHNVASRWILAHNVESRWNLPTILQTWMKYVGCCKIRDFYVFAPAIHRFPGPFDSFWPFGWAKLSISWIPESEKNFVAQSSQKHLCFAGRGIFFLKSERPYFGLFWTFIGGLDHIYKKSAMLCQALP